MKYLYPTFLILWVGTLGFETVLLMQTHAQVHRLYDQLELTAGRLNQEATTLRNHIDDIQAQSKQLEFLESLVNLLPQEKGFIRTQKAIAAEVGILRRKVGRRLGDELHIVVDTRANKLYLKKGLSLIWEADCSAGKGGMLLDKETGRRWEFVTPRGRFEVRSKIENPLWIKPDWAFVEAKEPIPPPNDPLRKVAGELGAYVLNLGDGYLIHGTKTEALLGHSVSHGCVRLGADNLKKLYESAPLGTPVYIY